MYVSEHWIALNVWLIKAQTLTIFICESIFLPSIRLLVFGIVQLVMIHLVFKAQPEDLSSCFCRRYSFIVTFLPSVGNFSLYLYNYWSDLIPLKRGVIGIVQYMCKPNFSCTVLWILTILSKWHRNFTNDAVKMTQNGVFSPAMGEGILKTLVFIITNNY